MVIGGTFKLKIGTIHPAGELRGFRVEGREPSRTTAASAARRPIQRSRRVTNTEHIACRD